MVSRIRIQNFSEILDYDSKYVIIFFTYLYLARSLTKYAFHKYKVEVRSSNAL